MKSPLIMVVLFMTTVCSAAKCLDGQKERQDDAGFPICCRPVTCHNQTFHACTLDGGIDKCVDCPDNKCGRYKIDTSKFDTPSDDLCQRAKDECDTTSNGGTLIYYNGCKAECRCDRRNGFFRFDHLSRGCKHSRTICLKETEWLNDQGACEACPLGYLQDKKYGICIIDPKATTIEIYTVTSTSVSNVTGNFTGRGSFPGETDQAQSTGGIIGGVVGVLLILAVLGVLASRYIKGRRYDLIWQANSGAGDGAQHNGAANGHMMNYIPPVYDYDIEIGHTQVEGQQAHQPGNVIQAAQPLSVGQPNGQVAQGYALENEVNPNNEGQQAEAANTSENSGIQELNMLDQTVADDLPERDSPEDQFLERHEDDINDDG